MNKKLIISVLAFCTSLSSVPVSAGNTALLVVPAERRHYVIAFDVSRGREQLRTEALHNPEVVLSESGDMFAVFSAVEYGEKRQLQLFSEKNYSQVARYISNSALFLMSAPLTISGRIDRQGARLAAAAVTLQQADHVLQSDVINLKSGSIERSFPLLQEQQNRPLIYRWIGEDHFLVISNDSEIVRLYDLRAGVEVKKWRLPDMRPVDQVALAHAQNPRWRFLSGGDQIVGFTDDGRMAVISIANATLADTKPTYHQLWEGGRKIGISSISNNGRYLVLPVVALGVSSDVETNMYFLVNTADPRNPKTVSSEVRFITSAISSSGADLVVSGKKGEVYVLDAQTGKVKKKYPVADQQLIVLGLLEHQEDLAEQPRTASGNTNLAAGDAVPIGIFSLLAVVVGIGLFYLYRKKKKL